MSETLARQWLAQDPDADTRSELEALLGDPNSAGELAERFAGSLQFGTAGLRGVLGAGPMRMNRVLVQKVSAGLGNYLVADLQDGAKRGVVVGYDGRNKSRILAEDTARVLLGMGIRVYLSTFVVPTPVVAYGVTHFGAAAGVMVTASHNPPEYNGYKVYWENGAQIIPPQDSGIATFISEIGSVADLALGDLDTARETGDLVDLDNAMVSLYLDGVEKLALHPGLLGKTPLTVAYTPMHGVGARFVKMALERAGVSGVHVEPKQEEPDGAFPTVAFPNPEEAGAMNLVFELAKKVGADLVLANDPDADRLAVALPEADGFTMLSGDQVGALLADYLLTEGPQGDRRLVATTLVSSQLLGIMAKDRGVDYRTTLTGFKWIANAAIDARRENDARFVMGYEEALGYSIGELVRDKDGVSAAALFCELTALAKSQGSSVQARLDALYRSYGVFQTKQVSLVLPGADGSAQINAHMQRFRDEPPKQLGGFAIVESHDLANGGMGLPASNVLVYFLEGSCRVIMRPSGTEPKLKCYYEVCEPVSDGEPVTAAKERAAAQVAALSASHQGMLA
ncbi:MAG: phospho-sugar mutase [Myxococcales bacterium]|nr:phospho-sugar mutase [Myxococcales bacterium]